MELRLILTALLATTVAAPALGQTMNDSLKSIFDSIVADTKRTAEIFKRRSPASGSEPQAPAPAPGTETPAQMGDAVETTGDVFPAADEGPEATDTQIYASSLRAGDPNSFDLLGLKLGMSAAEVNRVARKARPRWQSRSYHYATQPTFYGQARQLANQGLNDKFIVGGKVPESAIVDVGNTGTELRLKFMATPQGTRLAEIKLEGTLNGNTPAAFYSQLAKKYGPATNTINNNHVWCTGTDAACGPLNSAAQTSLQSVVFGTRYFLTLGFGYATWNANKKGIEAEAAKNAASRAKAVQF